MLEGEGDGGGCRQKPPQMDGVCPTTSSVPFRSSVRYGACAIVPPAAPTVKSAGNGTLNDSQIIE